MRERPILFNGEMVRSWAGIYGDGDPWVWVVSFKRVEVQP